MPSVFMASIALGKFITNDREGGEETREDLLLLARKLTFAWLALSRNYIGT